MWFVTYYLLLVTCNLQVANYKFIQILINSDKFVEFLTNSLKKIPTYSYKFFTNWCTSCNSYKFLKIVTSSYKLLQFLNFLQVLLHSCKVLQILTYSYKILQILTLSYKFLQLLSTSHNILQILTTLTDSLQSDVQVAFLWILTNTDQFLQSLTNS